MRSDSWDLPVWGPFEVLVKSVHTNTSLSVIACARCAHLHDVGQRCWVTEGLSNPPSGSFPEPPLSLRCLLFLSPGLPSVVDENRWNERWFLGIRPVRLHPPSNKNTQERESKGRSVPSWESAFVLVKKRTSVLSLTRDGEEGGEAKTCRATKLSICLNSLCACGPALMFELV